MRGNDDCIDCIPWWYLGVTTSAGAAGSGWGFRQTTASSMTVALLFDISVSNFGSSGGCWWFFGISRDCAIGTGKDSRMHTLRWTNAKSHCIGQGSHFSLDPHDPLAIALVCLTLAHGTNHRRQRNTTGKLTIALLMSGLLLLFVYCTLWNPISKNMFFFKRTIISWWGPMRRAVAMSIFLSSATWNTARKGLQSFWSLFAQIGNRKACTCTC